MEVCFLFLNSTTNNSKNDNNNNNSSSIVARSVARGERNLDPRVAYTDPVHVGIGVLLRLPSHPTFGVGTHSTH